MDDSDEEFQEMEEIGAACVALYYVSRVKKRPCRNSALSGAAYVDEILNGHQSRCREVCRMDLPIFQSLCQLMREGSLLRDTGRVKIEEHLAMFLFTIGHSAGNRLVQERFQHSGETDCLGAIDGTHISVIVGAGDQASFRERWGKLSQSVMAACSFDLRFLHVLSGWEGSAADGRVLGAAREKDFKVPEGKYYLVDAGYTHSPNYIAPYRGARYHLKEFSSGNQAPQNAKELFNHRHASLRNAIERIFGVLKTQFPILRMARPYPFSTQANLVIALCVLHNHIRIETGSDDWAYEEYDRELLNETHSETRSQGLANEHMSATRQHREAKRIRDSIAQNMWADYVTQQYS